MESLRRHVANEKGSTIVYVALIMAAVLSMAALAIDLGMLHDARSEAHRAADAAALAGASNFQLALSDAQVVAASDVMAKDYAGRNRVLGTQVQAAEVTVVTTPSQRRVRATVRRQAIPLWFARLFGMNTSVVSATAVAGLERSGTVECIAPFMIPDAWNDANKNGLYDAGDSYDPKLHGFGTSWRNQGSGGYNSTEVGGPYVNDYGRQVNLYLGSPNSGMSSGWYFPARIGDVQGANAYSTHLGMACPPVKASLGDLVYNEPGLMPGPTKQGLEEKRKLDPDARWENGGIVGSKYPLGCSGAACTGENSPRIMVVALFNPGATIPNGASAPLTITNFGAFFIETISGQADIKGRWVKVRGVRDNCEATNTCSNNLTSLRLVE